MRGFFLNFNSTKLDKDFIKSSCLFFFKGRVYSELGRFADAEQAYNNALKAMPNYRGVWNNLGNNAAMGHYLFGSIPSPFFIFDIILMFIIVQQIDNNFVTPIVVGESTGLHPMIVMIALLIGGTLMGPLGMLFAVPAAGIIKVVIQEITFVSQNSHLL